MKGIAYIPCSNYDIVVFKWEYFTIWNLSIKLEEDSSQFKPEWYYSFPSEDSSNKLILHVVLNKHYVTEFFFSVGFDKWNISIPDLIKVGINVSEIFIKEKEFIDALQFIPKTLIIETFC